MCVYLFYDKKFSLEVHTIVSSEVVEHNLECITITSQDYDTDIEITKLQNNIIILINPSFHEV